MRAIQLQQQPTERLKYDQDTKRKDSIPNLIRVDTSINANWLNVESSGHKIIADGSGIKIQETLAILESQSPFKNLKGEVFPDKMSKLNLMRDSCTLNHSQSEDENILDTLDINASFINLDKLEEKKEVAKLVTKKASIPILNVELSQNYESKSKSEIKNYSTQNSNKPIVPILYTLQTSIGGKSSVASGATDRQSEAFNKKGELILTKRSTENIEPAEPLQSERDQYVNLMINNHKTLGQKITEKMNKKQIKRKKDQQQSFIESNGPSSSFDSLNPSQLIVQTQDASNYTSMVSKNSKISKIMNGQYMQTKSSNYSSFYQNTRNISQEDSNLQIELLDVSLSKVGEITYPVEEQKQNDKIDEWLGKIDKNLNTFTTEQFEQLRKNVKTVGFNKACVEAQHQFGFLKDENKNIDLSFTNESVVEQQENNKKELKLDAKQSMVSSCLSSVIELPQSDIESQESIHMLSQTRSDNYHIPTNLLALNRKMYLNTEKEDSDSPIFCTGFLSTPMIIFDQNATDDISDSDGDNQNPCNHKATILNYKSSPPTFLPYLPLKLLSNNILNQFKNQCLQVSCGFEHCLALFSSGECFSWGYGGSGCLGHGNYGSVEDPKKLKDIPHRALYVEAGGYHNSVVVQSQTGREVYVWGRGDVGQLGLKQEMLTRDQMGLVSLNPQTIDFSRERQTLGSNTDHDIQIDSVALGDAHTLFLTDTGQVYSCGWHELGQLGITKQQKEQDDKAGVLFHQVILRKDEFSSIQRAKQISSGAVFSLALTEQGEVFVWGSNNNGQMGNVSQDISLSQQSIDSSKAATQFDIPMMLEFTGTKILNALCGDCHVIVQAEENSKGRTQFYAWGQGQIVEEVQGSENQYQDVICNQPIIINSELENKMIYLLEIDESNSEQGNQTSKKSIESETQLEIISQIEVKKSADKSRLLKTSELDMNYPSFTLPQDQRTDALVATFQQMNNNDATEDRLKKAAHKNASYSTPSDSNDLITIKNTEDYNNFLRKREQSGIISEDDRKSMIQFEQRIMQMMQNDTSRGTEIIGGGTSQRDYGKSNEFGSDLMIISEYPQQQHSPPRIKNAQVDTNYNTGIIHKTDLISQKGASKEQNLNSARNTLQKNNKKIVNSKNVVKRQRGTFEKTTQAQDFLQQQTENLKIQSQNAEKKKMPPIKTKEVFEKATPKNLKTIIDNEGQALIATSDRNPLSQCNSSLQSNQVTFQQKQQLSSRSKNSSVKKQTISNSNSNRQSSVKGSSRKTQKKQKDEIEIISGKQLRKITATGQSSMSNFQNQEKLSMLKSQNPLASGRNIVKNSHTTVTKKIELQEKRKTAGTQVEIKSELEYASSNSEMAMKQLINSQFGANIDQSLIQNMSNGIVNGNLSQSNFSNSQSSYLPQSTIEYDQNGATGSVQQLSLTTPQGSSSRQYQPFIQSSGGTGDTGRQALNSNRSQLSLKNKTYGLKIEKQKQPIVTRKGNHSSLGMIKEHNPVISVSSRQGSSDRRSRSPSGKKAEDIKLSPKEKPGTISSRTIIKTKASQTTVQTEQTPKRKNMFTEKKHQSAKSSPHRKASRELTDKLQKLSQNITKEKQQKHSSNSNFPKY